MANLTGQEAERAAQLTGLRQQHEAYLALVREGQKFQIVIPDEAAPPGSQSEPRLMLKMMVLHDEVRALAEAEIQERLKRIDAKMAGLGTALD
jgi:hypothetical protein